MSADPRVSEGLAHVRRETAGLLAELQALAPPDWTRPSNCPPWDVQTLAAHVANGDEFYTSSIRRGLAGDPTPALSREERTAQVQALAAAGPPRILAELRASADRFAAFYAALTAAQLDTLAFHNHGLRPARWFVTHRLGEVAFHAWDLRTSLGQVATLDAATIAYLLPTMLEVNLPVLYERGARGRGRLCLATRERTPRAWQLEADGETLRVQPAPDGADAPTLTLAAADLGLLLYGRVPLSVLAQGGRIEGDPTAADVLPSLLGRP